MGLRTRHEGNELQHQNQRAGRRFSQPEAVDHILRAEPMLCFNSLLRHISQHGIGPAKGHEGRFGEKPAGLAENIREAARIEA